MDECIEWLHEAREVFPKLNNKTILANYKPMSKKKLGYVSATIEKNLEFDAESLLIGKPTTIKTKRKKPKEFNIFLNRELQKIKNPALRKEIIQHIIIHELLHIEQEDLVTLSKQYNRRKKKRIHTNEFEDEIFNRFNQLRYKKGILEIEKREHLEKAINKILESINWFNQ